MVVSMAVNSFAFTCVEEIDKVVHISLPLSYAGNQNSGILDVLESWKCHYSSIFNGIVVGFRNVSFVNPLGRLIADQPCVHYDIKAIFSVFKPHAGSILKGTINKISKQHVGCVVHDCVNVSIFISSNIADDIADFMILDKEVVFHVTKVDVQRRVIEVKGVFTPKCVDLLKQMYPDRKRIWPEIKSENEYEQEADDGSSPEQPRKKFKSNILINENLSNNILSILQESSGIDISCVKKEPISSSESDACDFKEANNEPEADLETLKKLFAASSSSGSTESESKTKRKKNKKIKSKSRHSKDKSDDKNSKELKKAKLAVLKDKIKKEKRSRNTKAKDKY